MRSTVWEQLKGPTVAVTERAHTFFNVKPNKNIKRASQTDANC